MRLPEPGGLELLLTLRRAARQEEPGTEKTVSYTPDDVAEEEAVSLEDLGTEGPAPVEMPVY